MLLPTRAVVKANVAGSNQDTTPGTIASKGLIPSLHLLSKHKAVNESTKTSASTPTWPPESKTPGTMTPQPQGTSPMAIGTDEDALDKSPGTVKSDPKEYNKELRSQGEDS
jgi:hypothetical protein